MAIEELSKQTLAVLRSRLDAKVLAIAEMIKHDIYDNIIVTTVRDWFEGNGSIITLNNNINKNVSDRWPFLQKKIKEQLHEFEEETKTALQNADSLKSQQLDVQAISESVSQSISLAVGAIGTSFLAMLSGGAGVALISGGPVGWVIGGIIGAFAFVLGKTKIEQEVSKVIADKNIPSFIKKTAKGKVATQLKLNESKFEQEIHDLLQEQLKPIYEALNHGFQQ
jgi:gas vesicle protein